MKYNPLDGDRAAIQFNNQVERNASEKRWDAFYQGCKDARNHKAFNTSDFTNLDEIEMYKIGWNNIKNKKNKVRKGAQIYTFGKGKDKRTY